MPDARPGHGTPIDLAKLRTLHTGRVHGERRVTEGRHHPETGVPWKRVTTEAGSQTEHAVKGDRLDANVKVDTIRVVRERSTGKVHNL